MPFRIIYEDCETRVNECSEDCLKDEEEDCYATFDEAAKVAIAYLDYLIEEATLQKAYIASGLVETAEGTDDAGS